MGSRGIVRPEKEVDLRNLPGAPIFVLLNLNYNFLVHLPVIDSSRLFFSRPSFEVESGAMFVILYNCANS